MKRSFVYLITAAVLLLAPAGKLITQPAEPGSVRLMFYNAENLFDTYDDTLRDDEEFLPEGSRHWNYTRYKKKINSLYKTIVAAGGWKPPAIVALCEVENEKVLEDLIYNTNLLKHNYGIVHEESPDRRGIDVSLIYRKERVSVISYDYRIPDGMEWESFTSRSVLYVRFRIDSDTIHMFVNHWPSRRGGVLAGEGMRMRIAGMVKEKADSINESEYGDSDIVIMGDFNCKPGDKEIEILTDNTGRGAILKNLSDKYSGSGLGTYRYQGFWETIDQVLVSESLIKKREGLYTDSSCVSIFRPDFLLYDDPTYPGSSPFPTYRGYYYQGGYSDHLPVILDLVPR
jgi:hypothetical protein